MIRNAKSMSNSILFLVPRLHTNMLGWLEGLNQIGIEHKTLVLKSSSSENYFYGEPRHIKKQSLRLTHSSGKNSFKEKGGFPSLIWLSREISQIAPEYIIVRVEMNISSLIFLLAVKSTKIPFVIYMQWPLTGLDVLRSGIRRIIAFATSTNIITPSLSKFDSWTSELDPLKNNKKVFLVPFAMPIHESDTVPQAKLAKDSPLTFLTVGKFQFRKNHLESIKTFLNNKSFIENKSRVIIVGEVSTKEHVRVLREINEFLSQKTLGSRVTLKTNLTHQEALNEISECDVFFLLSNNEPASISNIEAMSFGKPVIVKIGNGTANYVQSEEGGFIVSDFKEFSTKITIIHENRNLLESFRKKNLERLQNISNPKRNAELLVRILKQSKRGRAVDA